VKSGNGHYGIVCLIPLIGQHSNRVMLRYTRKMSVPARSSGAAVLLNKLRIVARTQIPPADSWLTCPLPGVFTYSSLSRGISAFLWHWRNGFCVIVMWQPFSDSRWSPRSCWYSCSKYCTNDYKWMLQFRKINTWFIELVCLRIFKFTPTPPCRFYNHLLPGTVDTITIIQKVLTSAVVCISVYIHVL
jgi:hypothetical protein